MSIKCLQHSENHRYCIRIRDTKNFMKGVDLLHATNKKVITPCYDIKNVK